MYIKNKRGQSTVEYVLLVTAVVAVMIAFASNTTKGGFQDQLNQSLNTATQEIGTLSDRYQGSHAAGGGSNATPGWTVNVIP